jgi:Xaa-Pro dipeptidase
MTGNAIADMIVSSGPNAKPQIRNRIMPDPVSERAADLALKHDYLLAMLRSGGFEGLLVLEPANFAWLTAGAEAKGVLDAGDHPCLYFQGPQRWLICCNTDTQRLFDEELDGLGFHLKEWPWHWGRAQLLADLCHGKKIASDARFGECTNIGPWFTESRRTLTAWEQTRLRELGKTIAHALEATCRNLERGQSEEEVAGQVSHRLIHHGVEPLTLEVMADGRGHRYRRGGTTSAKIARTCMIQTTARKWGLHATASRTVAFSPLDETVRREHEIACRTTTVQIAHSVANAKVADILSLGERILTLNGLEFEWRLAPIGWLTGYAAVEKNFVPTDTEMILNVGQAIVWPGRVASAANADTILITDAGPQVVTPPEGWPVKRIRLGSATVDRPDILVRSE